VAETVISVGVGLNQNDSAAKIASTLHGYREALLVAAYLSVIYAAMFLIYLGPRHRGRNPVGNYIFEARRCRGLA
jgi:hypothetical protein